MKIELNLNITEHEFQDAGRQDGVPGHYLYQLQVQRFHYRALPDWLKPMPEGGLRIDWEEVDAGVDRGGAMGEEHLAFCQFCIACEVPYIPEEGPASDQPTFDPMLCDQWLARTRNPECELGNNYAFATWETVGIWLTQEAAADHARACWHKQTWRVCPIQSGGLLGELVSRIRAKSDETFQAVGVN